MIDKTSCDTPGSEAPPENDETLKRIREMLREPTAPPGRTPAPTLVDPAEPAFIRETLEKNRFLEVVGRSGNGFSVFIRSHRIGGRINEYEKFSVHVLLFLAPLEFWANIGCLWRGTISVTKATDLIIQAAHHRGVYEGPESGNTSGRIGQ